jgi:hypothetical protein
MSGKLTASAERKLLCAQGGIYRLLKYATLYQGTTLVGSQNIQDGAFRPNGWFGGNS